jgi:hypothetical protein
MKIHVEIDASDPAEDLPEILAIFLADHGSRSTSRTRGDAIVEAYDSDPEGKFRGTVEILVTRG